MNGNQHSIVDLPALFPERLSQLPVMLRILLENVVRNMQGEERSQAVSAIFDWLESCTSDAEIEFHPKRMLTGDAANTPEFAGMRTVPAQSAAEPPVFRPGGNDKTNESEAPLKVRIPDVIGVRLTGRLNATRRSARLARTVAERLSRIGVAGQFVEFYGPGVSCLTADDRIAIAKAASEHGAAASFFPVDEQTLTHLRQTGSPDESIALVKTHAQGAGLWFDPDSAPHYTLAVQINLSEIDLVAAEALQHC